jgi:hypothetical protein
MRRARPPPVRLSRHADVTPVAAQPVGRTGSRPTAKHESQMLHVGYMHKGNATALIEPICSYSSSTGSSDPIPCGGPTAAAMRSFSRRTRRRLRTHMLHVPTRARPLTYSILRGNDLADDTEGVRKQLAPLCGCTSLTCWWHRDTRAIFSRCLVARAEKRLCAGHSLTPPSVWVSLTLRSLGGQDGWQ